MHIELLCLSTQKKIHIFHVKNIFVDIDIEKLNDVLRANGHAEIDGDDDNNEHQFNEEDYDGHEDDEIKDDDEEEKEEEDNSD